MSNAFAHDTPQQDQEGKGQTTAILHVIGPVCPVRRLREWLEAAGVTESALFRQVPKGGERIGGRLGGRASIHQGRHCRDWARREEVRQPFNAIGLDCDCGTQRRIGWNMMEISLHNSTDVLTGYVREAEPSEQHASVVMY